MGIGLSLRSNYAALRALREGSGERTLPTPSLKVWIRNAALCPLSQQLNITSCSYR